MRSLQLNIFMVLIKQLWTGSKHTVISFSSIGNTVEGVNAEFYNLKNNGYNVIWVIDKNNSYFSAIDPQDIISQIKTENVYTIGSSMGGFNAITFASLYNVKKVLAFAPQYSMDPNVVPWENRWPKQIKWKNFKYPKLTFNSWTDYTVIRGHKGADKRHTDMFPKQKNINIQQVYGNHMVAENFKKAGTLYNLINDYFLNDVKIDKDYLAGL